MTRGTLPDATLDRTWRVIGLVLVAGGRAVDIALVETDGAAHIRRIETERAPLESSAGSLGVIVRTFMGDRALQPFAVDLIALGSAADVQMVADLRTATDVEVRVVAPRSAAAHTGFAAAERVAMAAVTQTRGIATRH